MTINRGYVEFLWFLFRILGETKIEQMHIILNYSKKPKLKSNDDILRIGPVKKSISRTFSIYQEVSKSCKGKGSNTLQKSRKSRPTDSPSNIHPSSQNMDLYTLYIHVQNPQHSHTSPIPSSTTFLHFPSSHVQSPTTPLLHRRYLSLSPIFPPFSISSLIPFATVHTRHRHPNMELEFRSSPDHNERNEGETRVELDL